jgi:hypothetical protein
MSFFKHRHRRVSWRRGLVGRIVIVLAALWLGWTIIGNTAADRLARLDAEAALAWRGDASVAMVSLAERQLLASQAPADRAEARRLAERALSVAPLEERALRVLALVAEMDGDVEQAEVLMKHAAGRSRRDGMVQIWSFNRLTQIGDFDGALKHADALMRSRSSLNEQISPTLMAYAIEPEAQEALLRFLAHDPPWRGWYLRQLAGQMDDPGIAYAIYVGLKEAGSAPSDDELRPYLQNLANTGRFEQAYLTWIHFLPEERRRHISFAYNGDFDYPPSGLPFDWMVAGVTGATTDFVATGDPDRGDAVRIEFANRRVAYRHFRKLLMLPPGAYRLTNLAKANDLQNERGLVWRVTCAEIDRQILGESQPIAGTFDWREFATGFTVPQGDCRAQWLTLVLASRVALEEHISGEVWLDNVSIRRGDPQSDSSSVEE